MKKFNFTLLALFMLPLFLMAETGKAIPEVFPKKDGSIIVDFSEFTNKSIWEPKVKTGKADAKVVKDDDLMIDVLRLRSNEASYYFQKGVNVDISKNGIFNWRWKVKRHPANGDVRKSSTDDQAVQVLLAFEGRNLISYVWDPSAPVGYSKDASIPFIVSQKILVIQSGSDKDDLNKWFEFSRDIKADYKALYGEDPPKLAGVAVQINSQHTETFCESFVSPFSFDKD
jgi:hypothetical protein